MMKIIRDDPWGEFGHKEGKGRFDSTPQDNPA